MTAVQPAAAEERALVLVDLQEFQRDRSLGPRTAADVVERANQLVEWARSSEMTIVYVMAGGLANGRDTLRVTTDSGNGAKRRPPGWDRLLKELIPPRTERDPVTTKRGWDAFFGSSLELQLRRHGVKEMVLSGISTNFGVEGTARAAVDRGFNVLFAEDAMTSWTEDLHWFAVRNIFPRLGRVRSTAEILGGLRAGTGE